MNRDTWRIIEISSTAPFKFVDHNSRLITQGASTRIDLESQRYTMLMCEVSIDVAKSRYNFHYGGK